MEFGFDVAEEQAREFERRLPSLSASLFAPGDPVHYARAPIPVEVLGGLPEECGGVVLYAPLSAGVFVAIQQRRNADFALQLAGPGANCASVTFPASAARGSARSVPGSEDWARRAIACADLLSARGYIDASRPAALSVLIAPAVPVTGAFAWGSALQVATIQALCGLFGVELGGIEVARLSHAVSSQLGLGLSERVAAITAALGEEGSILVAKCQPDDVLGQQPIPDDWRIVALDADGPRGEDPVRTAVAARMGFRILQVESRDKWGGYLCNMSPVTWVPWAERIPETMTGAEYVAQFGVLDDAPAPVDPQGAYPIRSATEHAIRDNDRAREMIALLQMASATGDDDLVAEAGALLLDSDRSRGRGAGRLPALDDLAGLAVHFGPARGIHGARRSSGGAGPLAVLCAGSFGQESVALMCDQYHHRADTEPVMVAGTSKGAAAFGCRRVSIG